MLKLASIAVTVLLAACAESAPPPAAPPSPGVTEAQPPPPPYVETKPDGTRLDLESDLAQVDAFLRDLDRRVTGSPNGGVQRQLNDLKRREEDMRGRLKVIAGRADGQADAWRRDLHQDIVYLRRDAQQLSDSMPR